MQRAKGEGEHLGTIRVTVCVGLQQSRGREEGLFAVRWQNERTLKINTVERAAQRNGALGERVQRLLRRASAGSEGFITPTKLPRSFRLRMMRI